MVSCNTPRKSEIMAWLLTAMIGGVILYCACYFATERCRYWEKRGFPHIHEGILDLIRFLKSVIIPEQSFDEMFNELYAKTKGMRYCGFHSFLGPKLLLRDPELICNVLINDFSHFVNRPFVVDTRREPLTNHLFAQDGDNWRSLRYKLAPTFTTGKLKTMTPQVTECCDDILTYIGGTKGPMDVSEILNSYTLNVIGSVAFGLKVEAHKGIDGQSNEFVQRAREFFKPSPKLFQLYVLFKFSRRISKMLGVKFVSDGTTAFFTKTIKDAIASREGNSTKRNDFLQLMINIKEREENNGGSKQDIVEPRDETDKELLENLQNLKGNSQQYKFTEQNIAANAFGFISGGSESTAAVICFALYELASNPHIQSKLQNEIDEKLSNVKFDFAAANSLTYLDQVVNETLRKHAPAPTIERVCVEDYRIPGTDDVIKKGEEVIIPVLALHKDPDYFPDPETFDPDRFMDSNAIAKGTFLPFSLGPRFCIAKRLALLKVKTFIARTLMLYTVKLNTKTKVPLTFTKNTFMKYAEGGIWIDFEGRNLKQ